jgi:hypothetical protein
MLKLPQEKEPDMKKWIALITLVLLVTACAPTPPPVQAGVTQIVIPAATNTSAPETPEIPPTDALSPTPVSPTLISTLPESTLSITELKYRVLAQFPDFFFCDSDLENEMVLAKQRFEGLQANQEQFEAILSSNNLSNSAFLTDQQKLLIYRESKKLNAISFERSENSYQFQIQTGAEGRQGSLITGVIDADGVIEIQKQESRFPTCPG